MKALRELDDEISETTVERLCERVEMHQAKFKLHHSKMDHFVAHMEDGDTYARALQVLEFEALKKHKSMVKKLLRDKMIKEPSLNFLMRHGKRYLKSIEWLPKNFTASETWAQNLRYELTPRSSKYLKAKLKPFTEWVQSELDNYGCVSNEEAKAKYTELYGAPKAQSA